MKIVEGRIKDATEITDILKPLALEFLVEEYTKSGKELFLESIVEDSVIKNIENGFEYFLAKDLDHLVGFIAIKEKSHIFNLFVHKSYHKRGVARQLWEHAKRKCLLRYNVTSFTVNASTFSIPVYEKLGFKRSGEKNSYKGVVSTPMMYKIADK